jgi:hypothetical protein
MGFIYVGNGTNDIGFKIGTTGRPEEERLKQHKTANPSFEFSFLFESPYYMPLEKELHHHFASKRIKNTKEWFVLNDGDLRSLDVLTFNFEAIIKLRAQVDLLKNQESSHNLLEVDSCIVSAYLRLRSLYEERHHLNQTIEQDESLLKLRIGLNDGIDGYVAWKSQVRRGFDRDLFEQDHPGLYDTYCRPTICRSFKLL